MIYIYMICYMNDVRSYIASYIAMHRYRDF